MDLLNEKAFKMIDKGNRPVQRKQLSAWPYKIQTEMNTLHWIGKTLSSYYIKKSQ